MSAELKARTIGEGLDNPSEYAREEHLAHGLHQGQKEVRSISKYYQYSGNSEPSGREPFLETFMNEMGILALTNEWTPMVAFFPLATVIRRPIQVVCPEVQPDDAATKYEEDDLVRLYTHRLVFPLSEADQKNQPITVIWCGPDPQKKTYTHFAPVVKAKHQGSPSLVGKRWMPHISGTSPLRKMQKPSVVLSRGSKMVALATRKKKTKTDPASPEQVSKKRLRVQGLTEELWLKTKRMIDPPLGIMSRTSDREERNAMLELPVSTPDEKVRGFLSLPSSKNKRELFPSEVPMDVQERSNQYSNLSENPQNGDIYNKMKRKTG